MDGHDLPGCSDLTSESFLVTADMIAVSLSYYEKHFLLAVEVCVCNKSARRGSYIRNVPVLLLLRVGTTDIRQERHTT